MIARRLLTIPTLLFVTVTVTLLLPALVVLALLLSTLPQTRGALPTLGFLVGYLWCETIGVVACGYIWMRYRDEGDFLKANYVLQRWWTNTLKALAERLFRLEFQIAGHGALEGPAAIVIPRHTSTADTIIPMACYATPRRLRMRYVLKKELLLDPCLDIVGNRLPNLFIDRGSNDSESARRQVAGLMSGIDPDEGALIYPEGTRYSTGKQQALSERFAGNEDFQAQLKRWPLLLPPRLGGTLAMLQANPGKDVIFCAHSGFEGSSHFSNLVNGSWMSARIDIEFWRVPYRRIPTDPDGQREFLFENWDRMHAWVAAHTPQGSDAAG